MTQEEASTVAARLGASSQSFCPALLWTYTGTGNTMTRMLIEVASGWYTGSVYTDLSLVDTLPGEYVCGPSVIAVKAHPQWHPFSSVQPDGIRPATPHNPPDAKDVCPCSSFTRAVAVIRDPYATFLAEYKRLRSHDYGSCSLAAVPGKECSGGHVSVIKRAEFNSTDFRHEVLRMAKEWAAMFDSYDAFKAAHPGGFYLARYEQLTAGPQKTRLQALAGILQALGVPQPAETTATGESESESLPLQDTQQGGNNEEKLHSRLLGYHPQQLACAFEAAKHPAIFRPSDPAGINQEFVYAADGAEALVCDVWRVVGGRAAQHGYGPYNGTVCAS
ncbi:hypothetical protein OEZ86_001622 [Tetradesmus obliquus]|nr:hypothetical protein OEZ86_001622 [Tetradesmus obliquus]